MTTEIESTKREMYQGLKEIKTFCDFSLSPIVGDFEEKMEAHLEALRKDRASLIADRDAARNQLQALQMASQTAAEVIRGLRSELEESRETTAGEVKAKTDPYTLGFNGAGKCSCPFPINTIERLHWMDGAREKLDSLNQSRSI